MDEAIAVGLVLTDMRGQGAQSSRGLGTLSVAAGYDVRCTIGPADAIRQQGPWTLDKAQ